MPLRRGYSLLELLVALGIAAVLAGLAISRYWRSRDNAYIAAMQSDLRTLTAAEELYRSDSARYTTELARLQFVRASAQVTLTVTSATASTWSATATHAATSRSCSAMGGVGSPGGVLVELSCP